MSKHHHHHECHTKEKEIIERIIDRCCCEKVCPEEAHFTREEALQIAKVLGVSTESICFDIEEFHRGLNVELEHGLINPGTNITNNDPIMTGKIALAHLNLIPDYYTRLAKMRREAREAWRKVRRD